MQKDIDLVNLVKSFQSLSMSLFIDLLFDPDPYSNEYLLAKSAPIKPRTGLSKFGRDSDGI